MAQGQTFPGRRRNPALYLNSTRWIWSCRTGGGKCFMPPLFCLPCYMRLPLQPLAARCGSGVRWEQQAAFRAPAPAKALALPFAAHGRQGLSCNRRI